MAAVLGVASLVRPAAPAGDPAATGAASDAAQAGAGRAAVGAVQDVVLVDQGEVARVSVRLTVEGGGASAEPVEVAYRTVAGTALLGTQVEPTAGSLTFAAGSPSGSEAVIDVPTLVTGPGDARSFQVELTAPQDVELTTAPSVVINAAGAAYLDPSLPTQVRVEDLLGRMTLEEKVGQMTQGERGELVSPREVARLGLGSVLSGGGSVPEGNTPQAWADMVDELQRQALSTRLQIPLIYGVDAVHGHSDLAGATIAPHNIGLGATRDPGLVRQIGELTAVELRATGVPWTFAPCLCVSRDERWGRSYESFGEDPALVTALAAAAVTGLQGTDPADLSGPARVLATAKHWTGDGGTSYAPTSTGAGYPIDQGVTEVDSLDELVRLHTAPYVPAVEAGLGSVMPSYSAVALAGSPPVRMHENAALTTDLLKGELGFDGFVVSDWEAIELLPGDDYGDKVARAVSSGVDMVMEPYRTGQFVTALVDQVLAGRVSQARVDDAVRRILTQKLALGLFEQPFADRSLVGSIGSDEHRAVARQAAAASQTLLANDGVLPLDRDAHVYVAGSNADDLGHQMGGWTISWQGGTGDTTTGTTILEGIREVAPGAQVTYSPTASAPMDGATVGVVVVGEPPYAEGIGDVGYGARSLRLSVADDTAIETVCAALPCVVLVVSGRPQLVTEHVEVIDALVASFLPGSEGGGVADVLFGATPFTGRLPLTWPRSADQVPVNVGDPVYDPLFAYGWGLRTDSQRSRLEQVRDGLPAGDARAAVDAVLAADVWAGSRLASDPGRRGAAIALLRTAAGALDGTGDDERFVQAGAVVSVARDLVQEHLARDGRPSAAAMAATATAEHALMSGRAGEAVALLADLLT